MRKFLASTVLFATFATVTYLMSLILWGSFAPSLLVRRSNITIGSPSHMYLRLQEIKNVSDVDILFLGSSHAYRGFDTRVFDRYGLESFNLGSATQTPLQTEVLLKRFLGQVNPKLIVYEVYPRMFTIDGVESALDIVNSDKNDFESFRMALKQNHITLWHTLVYTTFRGLLGADSDCEGELIDADQTYIKGGFVERKQLKYYKPMKFDDTKWVFNDQQFRSFGNNLSLIRKQGIRLVLVQAPMTRARYRSHINNDEFDDRMRNYGVYYNFSEIMDLSDELHFYDSHHLNRNGVELFNSKLVEILFGERGYMEARQGVGLDPDLVDTL